MSEHPGYLDSSASRWAFLEEQSSALGVVTLRMEVVYLNAAARALVPPAWAGRRCWEVFPVGPAACAARCPAIRAVAGDEITYCEETLYQAGVAIRIGVAVIPIGPHAAGERAVLLLRVLPAAPLDAFRDLLLEDARRMRDLCVYCAGEEEDGNGP